MPTGDEIRRAREARGWSQEQLARRVGISQPALQMVENGRTRRSRFLLRIAHVLGLDIAEPGEAPARMPLLGPIDFPVYACAEGGPGELVVDGNPVEFMHRPAPLATVRDAFGVRITGASMEPEFRQGDVALVNPHLPAAPEWPHIFYSEQAGTVRASIKWLRGVTPEQWLVTQHNPPAGMPKDFVLSRKAWQRALRVVGKYANC
jgi:transcriptional regulator with XRE-family HTH domain